MGQEYIDKVDHLCYSIRDNDKNKADELKDELVQMALTDTSNEDLLTAFKLLISYGIENDQSSCLESGMAVAFFSINNLINKRNDNESVKSLISFVKDTLFIFYLEKIILCLR